MSLHQLTPAQFEKADKHIGFILPDGQIWAGSADDYEVVDVLMALAEEGVIELPDLDDEEGDCGHPDCHLIEHMVEELGYVAWRKSHGEIVVQHPELDS